MAGCAAGGAAYCLLAWLRPAVAAPFYVGAALAAAPLGLVIGELAMAAIFFLIVTPLGLAQRLRGRDRLRLETSRDGKTYWRTKRRRSDASSYYRQS